MTSNPPDRVSICPENGEPCEQGCRLSGNGTYRGGWKPCHGPHGPHADMLDHNGGPPLDEPTLPMDMPENPKAIYGRAKPSLGLIPSAAMIEEAGVLQLGAAKYGPFNWRKDAVESMTYVHACLRHLMSWVDGEDLDPESGRSHLAHARACLGIILDAKEVDKLIDDRPFAGAASRMIAERTNPVNP